MIKIKEKVVNEWLAGNRKSKRIPQSSIREHILKRQNGICSICLIQPIWNNNKLTFILDHINGKSSDHSSENLRLICPNCDSQLSTFKSKNKNSDRNYDREYRRNHYKRITQSG